MRSLLIVVITGDTRSYRPEVQVLLEDRMRTISENICAANNVECEFSYSNSFTPTINWKECHDVAVKAAKKVLGDDKVNENTNPMMSSEDFGHFLERVPGCFVFLGGQREGTEVYPLHHAKFDYKDENLARGAEFFAEIVRSQLNTTKEN